MSETRQNCPRCGAPNPGQADDLCPACLLRLGLGETEGTLPTVDTDGTARTGDAEAPIPEQIGNWRPIRRLGEGGMGVVYLAVEIGPLGRHAALKRIKHGLDSERVLERFEQERRVLASMDHPGIARALDAGAAAQGDRFRRLARDGAASSRVERVHRVRPADRNARVHEPRAGRPGARRSRHAQRRLRPGRDPVRVAGRQDAPRCGLAAGAGARGVAADDPRGFLPHPQLAAVDVGGRGRRDRFVPGKRSRTAAARDRRRAGLDRDAGHRARDTG